MQLLPGYISVRPGYAGSVRLPHAERQSSRLQISAPATDIGLRHWAALWKEAAALNPASIPRHQEQEQQQQQQQQQQEQE